MESGVYDFKSFSHKIDRYIYIYRYGYDIYGTRDIEFGVSDQGLAMIVTFLLFSSRPGQI